jgi:hypothetical protein
MQTITFMNRIRESLEEKPRGLKGGLKALFHAKEKKEPIVLESLDPFFDRFHNARTIDDPSLPKNERASVTRLITEYEDTLKNPAFAADASVHFGRLAKLGGKEFGDEILRLTYIGLDHKDSAVRQNTVANLEIVAYALRLSRPGKDYTDHLIKLFSHCLRHRDRWIRRESAYQIPELGRNIDPARHVILLDSLLPVFEAQDIRVVAILIDKLAPLFEALLEDKIREHGSATVMLPRAPVEHIIDFMVAAQSYLQHPFEELNKPLLFAMLSLEPFLNDNHEAALRFLCRKIRDSNSEIAQYFRAGSEIEKLLGAKGGHAETIIMRVFKKMLDEAKEISTFDGSRIRFDN